MQICDFNKNLILLVHSIKMQTKLDYLFIGFYIETSKGTLTNPIFTKELDINNYSKDNF
jgi:hypothetical protein